MAAIEITGLEKTYHGGVHAVKGIDVNIADGEFIVLVGPSGCGKSTMLRMVAGLETITAGKVSIGDRVVNDLDPAERDIAMVFQNYALYPHMSVRQNLSYGLKNQGLPKAEIAKRVAEAARILEIGDYLERKPRHLSGGQRQRVAMGRAIVREPAAFLFDEPLSNLDAKLRVQMRGEIKQLQKRLGTTSMYVTHDQLEAMTLADRLVVLNGGLVEQIGTPLEVYRKPASTFVASFIGSPAMNLIKADHADGKAHIGEVSLNLHQQIEGRKGVILGVRPEDLLPVAPDAPGALALQVAYVEELGAHRLVHGRVGDQTVVAAMDVTLEIGEVVHVTADITALHIFDVDTQQRLN